PLGSANRHFCSTAGGHRTVMVCPRCVCGAPAWMCASTADEGKRITESSSSGTFTYECRCHEVSGGYDTLCEWVEVEEDGEESNANYGFVSAELGYTGGYYGMLRARSGSIGPWEQYSIGSSGDTDGTW